MTSAVIPKVALIPKVAIHSPLARGIDGGENAVLNYSLPLCPIGLWVRLSLMGAERDPGERKISLRVVGCEGEERY